MRLRSPFSIFNRRMVAGDVKLDDLYFAPVGVLEIHLKPSIFIWVRNRQNENEAHEFCDQPFLLTPMVFGRGYRSGVGGA